MDHAKEVSVYICGDAFPHVPEECVLVMRRSLLCADPVETQYYSTLKGVTLPACCIHCGSQDVLDDYDEYMVKMFENFSVVRPICGVCQQKGLEAKTWGKKFVQKKQRK